MPKRQIIEIDRDKCNGCGLCTDACAEGALVLDEENKAVLAREIYCDGLGACLDVCPTDALRIIERDSEAYDPKATFQHVLKTRGKEAAEQVHRGPSPAHAAPPPSACGCPGTAAREILRPPSASSAGTSSLQPDSELSQWPIQLHLVSPFAPYFNESDLLIAADCTAFSMGRFHSELLKGKKVVIACPKLDQTEPYVRKLVELFRNNTIYSVTVAIMQVPCCSGLIRIVETAAEEAGLRIPIKKVIVGIDGRILSPERIGQEARHGL